MRTIRFFQLDGEQKLDVISQMSRIILEENMALPANEDALAIELEQGYDPNQDFLFIERGDEVVVELRQL